MASRLLLILTTIALVLSLATKAEALPKNFRNVDVFYVGGMPSADDMDEFATLGINQIISLHRLDKDAKQEAEKLGMKTFSYPLRTRLAHIEEIMSIIDNSPPGTVFLHCLHGSDRTGAVSAYWLYTRRGYDPFAALATVMSPKEYHVKGLEALADEYSMSIGVDVDTIGKYSGACNGGLEGLKIRGGRWYTKLARNYLELTIGPPLKAPRKGFWEE